MNHPFGISLLFIAILTTFPRSGQAQPQTFPDFPDSPNPGGEGGGGDKTPPYVYREQYFLGKPRIWGVGVSGGRISFEFSSTGPVMRYNVVWSRPGKDEMASVWHDSDGWENNGPEPHVRSKAKKYIIRENLLWDTDYTIKVQAESWWWRNISNHQITPFAEVTFRTPPNPAISDRIDASENRNFINSPHKTTTLELEVRAVRSASKSTATALVNRSAAYGVISAGQIIGPLPPPVVGVPGPGLPVVFSPPLLEDNTQLWACVDAAARDADAGECSGIESAQAYCGLRGAQSAPDVVIANGQPGAPVRAVNGDACPDAQACRVVSRLQCDR